MTNYIQKAYATFFFCAGAAYTLYLREELLQQ